MRGERDGEDAGDVGIEDVDLGSRASALYNIALGLAPAEINGGSLVAYTLFGIDKSIVHQS